MKERALQEDIDKIKSMKNNEYERVEDAFDLFVHMSRVHTPHSRLNVDYKSAKLEDREKKFIRENFATAFAFEEYVQDKFYGKLCSRLLTDDCSNIANLSVSGDILLSFKEYFVGRRDQPEDESKGVLGMMKKIFGKNKDSGEE